MLIPRHANIKFALLLFFVFAYFILPGCNNLQTKINNADAIALKSSLKKKIIKTKNFNLVSYQKIDSSSKIAVIYIEGDGLAWTSKHRVSNNPTPDHPVALEMASIDNSSTVIYIARPCQYVDLANETLCRADYWTNKRASKEIIESIDTAISKIKTKSGIKQIRLVGYSGGATIAAILAAIRNDVIDLRTIAGNLDINVFSQTHNTSPLYGSLNPIDYAEKLVKIPQTHFVSKNDTIITHDITNSYANNLMKYDSDLKCVKFIELEKPTHTKGWTTVWQNQVKYNQNCRESNH